MPARFAQAALFLVLGVTLSACASGRGGPVVVADREPYVARALGIPPGHLPPPGECRVWVPGVPSGHQAPPRRCDGLSARVPLGGWLVYTPRRERPVRVWAYDEARPEVAWILFLDRATGRFLTRERP